jgi:hypothetical protein
MVTGFCIKKQGAGETDGPLGTVALAYALTKLGKRVIIVTDRYSSRMLKNSLACLGLMLELRMIDQDNPETIYDTILAAPNGHILAIERPGRAKDGKRYSMSGEDISDIVPDADALFQWAHDNGIKTSAIGDGGNEIGMGKIRAHIESNVYLGEQIAAVFPTDNLIVAGTSNWGSHALAAVLSVMTGQMLMYDEEAEMALLKVLVDSGAVDGCTGAHSETVDGISLEQYMSVFRRIRAIAIAELKREDSAI